MKYISEVSEHVGPGDLETFVERARLGQEAKEVAVTLAERLIEKGIEKGRMEGRQAQAAHAVLAALEARGLMVADEMRERILCCTDLETLDRWLRRAVTAQSSSEVLGA